MPNPTKIIRLSVSNVKRLHAVEIRPDGALVTITGKNGAGKSSVLDAIWMALGGKKAMPRRPVREGADEALIELDLGDILVTRKIKPDGRSTLKVTSGDGASYSSPQALLDKLVAGLSFDPLAFARMPSKEQREVLRELVGLDTSAIEGKRSELYSERTTVKREVKRLEGVVSGVAHHPDAPAEEVSVAELSAKLGAAEEHQRKVDQAGRDVSTFEADLARAVEHRATIEVEVERVEQKLSELRGRLEEGTKRVIPKHGEKIEHARKTLAALEAGIVDRDALREQIEGAEATNAQVRGNRRREDLKAQHAKADKKARKLSASITALDKEKAEAIAGAEYPLEGLTVDDEGVLLNGFPLEQGSSAEQLRASVAIGLALNPQLRVLLVRDGSLLDDDSMQLLSDMATAAKAQVWLEVVGDGADGVGVVIEDGAIRGAAEAAE